MDRTYWHKQTPDTPLFPDMLWSRPENRAFAGKLLVIGGNAYGFAAPAEAYAESMKAGVGLTRVLLPLSVKRELPRGFIEAEFAPATPSGSFAQTALGELLPAAAWADGVLVAGDLGRNSETAILLEKFVNKYQGPLTLTKDAVDYFVHTPQPIIDRPETLFVLTIAQLQKLAMHTKFTPAFTFNMDLLRLVDALHNFTLEHPIALILKHLENIFVAVNGQVSSTRLPEDLPIWRVKAGAHASVWWLQNPNKPFEALTTSLVSSI